MVNQYGQMKRYYDNDRLKRFLKKLIKEVNKKLI